MILFNEIKFKKKWDCMQLTVVGPYRGSAIDGSNGNILVFLHGGQIYFGTNKIIAKLYKTSYIPCKYMDYNVELRMT